MKSVAEVMPGTLDLLLLKALALRPMHGWGITSRIQEMSQDSFHIGQGSLYPALRRCERRGWVTSYWRATENNRLARYYDLTAVGKRRSCTRRPLAPLRRGCGPGARGLVDYFARILL